MNTFDKNILSSAHINFLFGAGVNGASFKTLSQFVKTNNLIKSKGVSLEDGFEDAIDELDDDAREEVLECFKNEFKELWKDGTGIDWKNGSICNIDNLLRKTYSIVRETQNRNDDMKQVNIFTVNYDEIIEHEVEKLGFFYNAISASYVGEKSFLLNVIGYDYVAKRYIPSFLISKLHGNIENPILPGKRKYQEILNENYFEIAFNMKEQLSKQNSILIVIGYSGNDKHINKILKECVDHGLLLMWYRYGDKDTIPIELEGQVIVRDQDDQKDKKDMTAVCFEDLEKAWEEK